MKAMRMSVIEKKLEQIQQWTAEKKFEKNLKWSLVVFFVAWFVTAVFLQDLTGSLVVGLVAGTIGFVFSYQWPLAKKRLALQKAGAELPFVLLSMSIELNLSRPFEKVLEKASLSGFLFAAAEFKQVVFEINQKGASVSTALGHLANRFSDLDSKRAIIQLIHAYEHGNKKHRGGALKRIAVELLAKQRIAAKAFSSKLAVFSLVFIAVSAIVPALFSSFVVIGSGFLDFSFAPEHILFISAIGFPLLDIAILALIRHQTPVFLR